jgi:hypothetical protein
MIILDMLNGKFGVVLYMSVLHPYCRYFGCVMFHDVLMCVLVV